MSAMNQNHLNYCCYSVWKCFYLLSKNNWG